MVFGSAIGGQWLAVRGGNGGEVVTVLLGKDDEGAALLDEFIKCCFEKCRVLVTIQATGWDYQEGVELSSSRAMVPALALISAFFQRLDKACK